MTRLLPTCVARGYVYVCDEPRPECSSSVLASVHSISHDQRTVPHTRTAPSVHG